MPEYGYAGRVLFVDLTSGELRIEDLKEEYARDFMGGFGLVAGLLYDHLPKGCDPLSPENVMVMAAGVLGGTPAPGASKIHMGAKMANHRIGAAGGGGNMGFMLKHSGFDAVLITGKSDAPVYLKLAPVPEICDAANDLWGLDLIETTEKLWDRHIGSSVVAIGVASENLVKNSVTIVDNVASLGRGGLGTVMGSKNLKAIVACGGSKLKLYDTERFRETAQEIYQSISGDSLHERWVDEGVMVGWERWRQAGFTNENLTKIFTDEDAAKLWDQEAWKRNKIQNIGCMSCPISDKHFVELRDGPFKGSRIYMSSFLHIANSMGVQLQLTEFDKVLKAYDVCNRYGIDHFSFPALFNFAVMLYKKGILTKKDTDGLELKIDFDTALEVMKRMAHRENIGDILADGWVDGVKRLGKEAEAYAHHIKGIDPMQDGRNLFGTEHLGFVTNPRGAHIAAGESPSTVVGRPLKAFIRYAERFGIPEEAKKRIFSEDGYNTGRLLKWAEEHYSVFSSLGVCVRQQVVQRYSMDACCDLYRYATGLEMDGEELHQVGARIWNTFKMLNVREGYCQRDEFPEIWFQPLEDKGQRRVMMDYFKKKEISREDAYKLLDDYYDECEWELERAIPTAEKLEKLGLSKLIEDLPDDARKNQEND